MAATGFSKNMVPKRENTRSYSGYARFCRVLATVIEKGIAAIDGVDMAGRADAPGQHDGGVAEAGAGVHHLFARVDLELREDRGAVQAETADKDMFVLYEFGNQDLVPELDEFRGGRDDLRHGGVDHGAWASVHAGGWNRRDSSRMRAGRAGKVFTREPHVKRLNITDNRNLSKN
jgi:hypothetical protein